MAAFFTLVCAAFDLPVWLFIRGTNCGAAHPYILMCFAEQKLGCLSAQQRNNTEQQHRPHSKRSAPHRPPLSKAFVNIEIISLAPKAPLKQSAFAQIFELADPCLNLCVRNSAWLLYANYALCKPASDTFWKMNRCPPSPSRLHFESPFSFSLALRGAQLHV